MLAAYCKLQHAQQVKKALLDKGVLNFEYKPVKEMGLLYFPIVQKVKVVNATIVDTKFHFPQKEVKRTIQDVLKGKLTSQEMKLLPRSQEIVGKIMILEVPNELLHKEKEIAEGYLEITPHIETIVRKSKMHSGVYRTRGVKILAGKRSKETVHLENGVKVKLHLERVYYSARSANERLRTAKLVKKGEEVLVMFSGAAPFPLVIAKNAQPKEVYGIELNPLGFQYAVENVALNKMVGKVRLRQGDVRKIVPALKRKFDRILMPLPKTGEEFLNVALPACKEGGMVHLYAFLDEKEIDSHAKYVKGICTNLGYSVRIVRKVKCGQFSPGTYRVCYDIKIREKVKK